MAGTITQQQADELQALAGQVCDASEAVSVATKAWLAASEATLAATTNFDSLRRQLYAQLNAYGITPGAFVLGNYSFAPNDTSQQFEVTPTPSFAAALPPISAAAAAAAVTP